MSREFDPAKSDDDTIELTPDTIVGPMPADSVAQAMAPAAPVAQTTPFAQATPMAQPAPAAVGQAASMTATPAAMEHTTPYVVVQAEPSAVVQTASYTTVQAASVAAVHSAPDVVVQTAPYVAVQTAAALPGIDDSPQAPAPENIIAEGVTPISEGAAPIADDGTIVKGGTPIPEGASEPWAPPTPQPPAEAASPTTLAQPAAHAGEPPLPPVPPTPGTAPTAGDEPEDSGEPDDIPPMSLTEHLGELRTRLVRSLIGATLGFFLCYNFSEQLFMWLAKPLAAVMPTDTRLIYTSVPEGFFVYLKVAFVAGVFVASPYIFYQIWAFIAPGLYREERRQVLPLALFSALFFLFGASFCYFMVFPYAFTFFMSYSTGMIVAMPSIDEYLNFSLKMILAFGLIFEMPLFAFFLARMGVITAAWMRRVRRYAALVVFVVAAILTPPDVFSQLLMAVPMLVLYEISIYVAAAVGRKEPDSTKERA